MMNTSPREPEPAVRLLPEPRLSLRAGPTSTFAAAAALAVVALAIVGAPRAASADAGDVLVDFPAPGDSASGLGWDGTHLWVANLQTALGGGRNRVTRHDPVTFAGVDGFDMVSGNIHHGLAFDGPERIWTDDFDNTDVLLTDIVQIDTRGRDVVRFDAHGTLYGVAFDPVSRRLLQVDNHSVLPGGESMRAQLWVLDSDDGAVVRGPIELDILSARGVAWDGAALWVASRAASSLIRVDVETGAILSRFTAPGDGGLEGVAWDGECLWLSDTRSDRIYRVDHGVADLPRCVASTGGADAGPSDAGPADAASDDGGALDAGPADAALNDASRDGSPPSPDGSMGDAGFLEDAASGDAEPPPPPPARRGTGCGCRVPGPGGDGGGAPIFVLICALALGWRRRRTGRGLALVFGASLLVAASIVAGCGGDADRRGDAAADGAGPDTGVDASLMDAAAPDVGLRDGTVDAVEADCSPGGAFEGDECVCGDGYRRCGAGCCPWRIEDVDTAGWTGGTTSLALDSTGRAHISYPDTRTDRMRYAWQDDAGWNTETVDEPRVGWHSSLALDADGRPHISYFAPGAGDLRYAHHDGTRWTVETVDSEGAVGRMTSLALDASGAPHISYHDTGNDDLKYAVLRDGAWVIQAVDAVDSVGDFTALALDSADRPHIAYHHILDAGGADPGNLHYAHLPDDAPGGVWQIEVVDRMGIAGWFNSIALDQADRPLIAYYDDTDRDVHLARREGDGAWTLEVVDAEGDVGDRRISLALDGEDRPHLSYYDTTRGVLRYARWTGARWALSTVTEEVFSGQYSSLALSEAGEPQISFVWRDSDSPTPPPDVRIWLRIAR